MTPPASPVSIVAERAVRYLRSRNSPVDSVTLASEILSTRTRNQETARKILETAFGPDPRLQLTRDGWITVIGGERQPAVPDRTLVLLRGGRPGRRQPFLLSEIMAVRLRNDTVISACGGETGGKEGSKTMREAVSDAVDGAMVVTHDPPGSLAVLEEWLDKPLNQIISLRLLGHIRLGLPASNDLPDLAGALGISWRDTGDPLDIADTLDSCLEMIRKPEETLSDLVEACNPQLPPLNWSRFDFDREHLEALPRDAGVYRFFDEAGKLLYVGKARNLQRRVGSYFGEASRNNPRVRGIIENLYRIEIEPAGSELEALLREAEQIRKRNPAKNVQRQVHAREGVSARLRSILILEPAAQPYVLCAYLIRDGRLLDKVPIGPRGGGLKRIEKLLNDKFFYCPDGPVAVKEEPDLDVEMVVRWLTANRDRVVAFDPTDMQNPAEVTDRLRWFLAQGSPFDPDGSPIHTR